MTEKEHSKCLNVKEHHMRLEGVHFSNVQLDTH